jgi:ribonuclease P protein component
MRTSAEFSETIRRGARAGRTTLVVHCRAGDAPGRHVGFVVSKAVGGAVVRNRVRRRLRGLVMEALGTVPDGGRVVVRANPPAAGATFDELRADLGSALRAAVRRAGGPA